MKRPALVYSSLLLLGFLLAGLAFEPVSAKDETYKYLSSLSDTIDLVQRNYVDDVSLDNILVGAHTGLLEELDAESYYLTPGDLQAMAAPAKSAAELGVDLSKRHGYATVVAVLPGSPADGHLFSGDYVRSIDGASTREMSLLAIQTKLAGAVDSEVRLKVLRRTSYETESVTLKRAIVPKPLLVTDKPEPARLRLRLSSIDESTIKETAQALREATGLEGVVLDLRGCSLGPVTAGANLADLFVDSGALLRVNGKRSEDAVKRALIGTAFRKEKQTATDTTSYTYVVDARPEATAWRGPLVVLIDAGTAGPAEVVAAAVSGERAKVIGKKSFGRAAFQDVIPLDGGTAVRLTIARVLVANGTSLLKAGLEPTESIEESTTAGEDPALKRALELLRSDDSKKKAA